MVTALLCRVGLTAEASQHVISIEAVETEIVALTRRK